jgi:DNA-binding NarL/FixJ family response regulator
MVDEHALFRDGIREILETNPDLKVIGEAGSGPDGVQIVAARKPDVVLLNDMPGAPVETTIEQILKVSPNARIIVLSTSDDFRTMSRAIGAGAYGYLLKSVSRHELVGVIRASSTTNGRIVVSVSRGSLLSALAAPEAQPQGARPISKRELEVLRLTADALSNAQIARALNLTESTVKRHLRQIFSALGAVSRIDAVNKAISAGILPPPRPTADTPPVVTL